MPMTLLMSPVTRKMPSMPEPASATAIGTPTSMDSTSARSGSQYIMSAILDLTEATEAGRSRCRRLFPEQQRIALAHPRQVDQHRCGKGEESERHQAIGRSDQHRYRAERGVVGQRPQRLFASGVDGDQAVGDGDE